MKDRAMQALYLLALEPIAETTGDPNSYGFRPERSTADAIEQCFNVLSHVDDSATWVLEGDIKGCFDHISHEWMLQHIPDGQMSAAQMAARWLRGKTNLVSDGSGNAARRHHLADAGEPDPGWTGADCLKERFRVGRHMQQATALPRCTSSGMRMTSSSPARPRAAGK